MDSFHGRTRELALLNEQYSSNSGSFIPVYGRRRVGKTTLLRQFCSQRPTIFFVGKQAPQLLQRQEFLAQAALVLDEPLLAKIPPPDWKTLLLEVRKRWRKSERLVIVLDEFQWTAAASPELPSVLQDLWDAGWQADGKIMLILCGSYVGFMEREVLGSKSPLFGRRTAQIQLRPFGFREAQAFHEGISLVDATRAYFICGGVPAYHQAFRSELSIEQNIRRSILEEFAPLFREADFLLREELREVQNYHALLQALAKGSLPANVLAERTSIAAGSISYYLSQLEGLGYVQKRYPLTGRQAPARNVRYRLADSLLSFWFRFVFPNLSYLSAMGPDETFRNRVEPHLPAYFGHCFEDLCREALPLLYRSEGVTAAFEVGEYWSKQVQIDVVGHRADNVTDLGECKWGPISSAAVTKELQSKVDKYPNARNATIGHRIFARHPNTANLPRGVKWHCLEDLYGIG
ncbi:MAG: ATP-binding protein [Deltaproteobacteria bacterium]|nr:ATP-binding protein [Deltaproteobacteria bacterium]